MSHTQARIAKPVSCERSLKQIVLPQCDGACLVAIRYGSKPEPGVIKAMRLLLVLVLALKKFSLSSPVFLCPQKSTLLNSNARRWGFVSRKQSIN